jgi:hypothetical protein
MVDRGMKLASFISTTFAVLLVIIPGLKAQTKEMAMDNQVFYRTAKVDGLTIFYREAGPKDAPILLLLHGLPSSSRMFQPLLGNLSDEYLLIAPDYPGFGHSDWPDPQRFDYTFDYIARVIDDFTQALSLTRLFREEPLRHMLTTNSGPGARLTPAAEFEDPYAVGFMRRPPSD